MQLKVIIYRCLTLALATTSMAAPINTALVPGPEVAPWCHERDATLWHHATKRLLKAREQEPPPPEPGDGELALSRQLSGLKFSDWKRSNPINPIHLADIPPSQVPEKDIPHGPVFGTFYAPIWVNSTSRL